MWLLGSLNAPGKLVVEAYKKREQNLTQYLGVTIETVIDDFHF